MQELLDKLKNTVGLSESQASGALSTIKDFVKEKFPMFEGALDSVFGSNATEGAEAATTEAAVDGNSGLMDKAGDMLGDAKEKLSEMTGEAGEKLGDLAEGAQEMAKDALDKLKGLFGK